MNEPMEVYLVCGVAVGCLTSIFLADPIPFSLSLSIKSTYPLGGYVSAGLILSMIGAIVATIYATASCRFVSVTFQSADGNFEEYFSNQRGGTLDGSTQSYKALTGLFQWLRPSNPEDSYSHGSCVGYQQTMLSAISDSNFEAARIFAVFAVLLAVVETLWTFSTACIDMNRLQLILYTVLSFGGTLCAGMTFLFHKSSLCTSIFQGTADCRIEEGGLVMIIATILWFATFLITVLFAKPNVLDFKEQDEIDKAAMAREMKRSKGGAAVAAAASSSSTTPNKSYSFDSQTDWTQPIPSRHSRSPSPRQSQAQRESHLQYLRSMKTQQSPQPHQAPVVSQRRKTPDPVIVDDVSQPNHMEVYISKRLDRIERLAEV
jgi:hypothetical protein